MNENKRLWDLTMSNIQRIGNKEYVFAPKEIILVDKQFQRSDECSKYKINQLVKGWNPNKLDALKGNLHPETCQISIIDGYHRVEAMKILGLPGLVIEILQGLPEDPEERLIAEATLFATQGDEIDKLTPVQKHKANVLRGIKENVALKEVTEKYHINLKKNPSHGRVTTGELAGFTMALGVAKTSGKNMLDDVLNILCAARWNLSNAGLSANAISFVYNLLRLHPENKKEVSNTLVNMIEDIEPNQLFAQAYTKYPNRKERERILMYVEDEICERLRINRVYTGGSITVALNKTA